MKNLKCLLLLILLTLGLNLFAQAPLKQFGTRIYDEAGRRVTFADAVKRSKGKSNEAEMAFRLAEYIRDEQVRGRIVAAGYLTVGIIPRYDSYWNRLYYNWLNLICLGAGTGLWIISNNRQDLEEVLTVGVAAYNKSLQEEAKAP